jgi:hypothetical protein
MKRLIAAVAVVVVLFTGATALAKLSRGDKSKLKKGFALFFSDVDKDQADGRAALNEFFAQKGKLKELAGVEDLSELLAAGPVRATPRTGVVESKEWALKDSGIDTTAKFPYVVSLPKKYSGGEGSEAWPMILCIPDKGEKAEDHIEKYWKNKAIRDAYVIIVLGFEYPKVQVTRQKTVEEKGPDDQKRVRIEEYKERVDFSWTQEPERVYGLQRFWASMSRFLTKDYKVDPNRVILDGTGFGADGALAFASASTWRFSGLILRGGELDVPTLTNLAHLPVLSYEMAGASEGVTKVAAKLKELGGDQFKAVAADAEWSAGAAEGAAKLLAWLDAARRARYPLPSRWVRTNPAERTGYWASINEVFDPEQPAEITVNSDVKKARIDITTINVAAFDLYLNDVLVNLDKEFEIFVNNASIGKFEIARSSEQFLSHLLTTTPRDPGGVFTAEILERKIDAPPAPEKEDEKPAEDGEKPAEEKPAEDKPAAGD